MNRPSKHKQAVLLFARTPESESRAKRSLTKSLSAARRVYELFLRQVLRELSKLPQEVQIVISSDEVLRLSALARSIIPGRTLCFLPQSGSTPKERLLNAIISTEDLNVSSLVVLGADTPGLKAQHLTRALSFAADGCIALGPAVDGGFYLLAGQAPLVPLLVGMSFGGSAADTVIVAAVAADKPLALLERLADLDTAQDLDKIKADLLRNGESTLLDALSTLLFSFSPPEKNQKLIPALEYFIELLLRGPPTLKVS